MESSQVLKKWCNLCSYYKSAVFICIHKAYQEKLPVSVTNHIILKRSVGYTLRAPDSLSILRFNTRYMKDSLEHRGALLWNCLISKHCELVSFSCYRNLKWKLKSLDNFKNFTFKDDFQSVLRTLESLFTFLVLIHVRHHKM